MDYRTDILYDQTGDVDCIDGDFVTGASDDQHVEDILYASPGHFKQFPMIGASVSDAINGSLTGELKNKIRINLEADGYEAASVEVAENQDETETHEMVVDLNYVLK